MLLPIVLLLASANPIQQAKNVAPTRQQTAQPPSSKVQDSGNESSGDIIMQDPNTGVIMRRHNRRMMPDQGMILPLRPSSNDACMSITTYVFSDGENPRPKYVTNCPNLDVPFQNERAHRQGGAKTEQPNLERTKQ